MKKLILLLAGVFGFFYLNGQRIEFIEGINATCFYSDFRNTGETGDTYSPRLGQEIGICIDKFSTDRFRVGLKLANYKGVYDHSVHAMGGGSDTHLDINKYVIALEAFPLNFYLFTHWEINVGGEFSCLLYDATTGNHSSWQLNPVPFTYPATIESYEVYEMGTWDGNKQISGGVITRFAYEIALSEDWFFTPQFLFYVGLTDEFKNLSRTMRPYLQIGLARKMQKKTR